MALLVISIGFMKNILDLLADVLSPLNESSGLVDYRMIRGILFLCGARGSETSMGPKSGNPRPS
jgi:hypothetical protein